MCSGRVSAYQSLIQRIVVRCHLSGLTPDEVGGYLAHRLRLAGADVPVFEYCAIEAIAQASSGLLRRIDRLAPPGTVGRSPRQSHNGQRRRRRAGLPGPAK